MVEDINRRSEFNIVGYVNKCYFIIKIWLVGIKCIWCGDIK